MTTLSKRLPIAAPMKRPDEKSLTDSVNRGWRCTDHCQIFAKAREAMPIIIKTSAFFDLINTGKTPNQQTNPIRKAGDHFDARDHAVTACAPAH